MKIAGVLMCIVLSPLVARADGGAVCLHDKSGQFLVTVFVSPWPLRAGPVDTSVLVQDEQTGSVVFNAAVKLVVKPLSGEGSRLQAEATRENATNKLLQAARFDLPEPGWWMLTVVVSRGSENAVLSAKLQVAPALNRVAVIWPFLLFPPFAIGLFAVRQMRMSRRSSSTI